MRFFKITTLLKIQSEKITYLLNPIFNYCDFLLLIKPSLILMSLENINVPKKTKRVPTQCQAVRMFPKNQPEMSMEKNFLRVKSIVIVKLE